jgi:hypothetical protein
MFVEYDSLLNEISSVLSNCRLAAHQARLKALSTLLQGLLLLGEASLSGMGRGAALVRRREDLSRSTQACVSFAQQSPC